MKERSIYLIRHAEPESGGKKRYLGQSNPDLSVKGIAQAGAAAGYMEKYEVSEIYSSDLIRAYHTAEIIAAKFNLPVKTDVRLREVDTGKWEGLTFEEVLNKFPDEYDRRGRDIANYAPPEGESFSGLKVRALAAFYEIAKSSTGDVVIVAHSGVNRVILCTLMQIPLENLFTIKVDYASVCTISVKGNEFTVKDKIFPEVQ